MIKLNDSFSGEGNAIFRYPETDLAAGPPSARRSSASSWPCRRRRSTPISRSTTAWAASSRSSSRAKEKLSPSAQLRISPRGEVLPISTHDQILGGPSDQVFLGCSFPARDDYRQRILEAAMKIGEVLAANGVVSRFAIDFLVWRDDPEADWNLAALEINLRMGGTTHPYLALQFLTGGHLDRETGLFFSPTGLSKYYRATDNLHSDTYRGLLPEDLIEILTVNRLHYSHATDSGVLFHLIGAVSEFGKLGLTAIGNSPEEADALYYKTLEVLDRETAYGR